MIDAHRVIADVDVLMRCLVECDIELDGEAVSIKVDKQRNPWSSYRLETAKAAYDVLKDLQKAKREDK